jgi:pyruvate,water dikinase
MTPAQLQFMRLFRGPAERLQQTGATLKGMGASRGVVRAPARVIRDLSEADRLQPGEVLVCETTSAPWTPLFAIAGGVVTDSGGILSHSAICAREYGIPCVVGTSIATRRVPDGATITVDGVAGTVEIDA